jgi:hypothetical protein
VIREIIQSSRELFSGCREQIWIFAPLIRSMIKSAMGPTKYAHDIFFATNIFSAMNIFWLRKSATKKTQTQSRIRIDIFRAIDIFFVVGIF